jgi:hypothetical protein
VERRKGEVVVRCLLVVVVREGATSEVEVADRHRFSPPW